MRRYIKTTKIYIKLYFKQKNWVFTGQIPYEYSIWSEWQGSNLRPDGPKPPALPAAPHPEMEYEILFWSSKHVVWTTFEEILREQEKRDFLRVSRVSAFREKPTGLGLAHPQSRRATNCATPGYWVVLSGWAYSPKAGAPPAALHPEMSRDAYYSWAAA